MNDRVAQGAVVQSQMVTDRRHLHQQPEVGLALPDTHDYVAAALQELGYTPEVKPAAGLTVAIPGTDPDGVTSVLRADMDALPVTERTGLSWSSQRPGAMHACGHDLHMAMLLGAAHVLAQHPPRRDTVLAFQPGEESDRGAVATLTHDNLSALERATAFALHVHATLPAHTVNHRPGVFMANGDWFRVSFTGPGAHASQPHLAGNPIEAGARFVLDAKQLVERLSSDEHLVATVTESLMGNSVNVIPAVGSMRGTLRTLSQPTRSALIDGLRDLVATVAEQTRTVGEFELLEGYPAVVNDTDYDSALVARVSESPLGELLRPLPDPSMVIEDFSYFLQRWPGAMVYLGAQLPGRTAFNHASDADFDETVLATGCALLLMAADGFDRRD